jgi:cytochrome c oxidase subunit 2
MRHPLRAAVVALLGLTALSAPVAARLGFPDPVNKHAETIEGVYFQIVLAGILVFLFVFGLLAFILVRYRESGGHGRVTFEKERDNIRAEATWTLIPLAIVLWVGVISYQALVDLGELGDAQVDDPLVIDIRASQWVWQADYAESGVRVLAVASPDLESLYDSAFYVPADTPLLFRVTGNDVIHSFNIERLGHTVDAVPGQINELLVRFGLPAGEYFTQCKEDCLTPGHSYMHAFVQAVPQAEFDAWVVDTLAGAAAGLVQTVPVEASAADLDARQGTKVAKGAHVIVQVANNDTVAHTFTLGNESRDVPPGSLATFELDPTETGTLELSDDAGNSVTFTIVEPTQVSVELDEFAIAPATLRLESNTVYVIVVENAGSAPHNLYIGANGADGKTDAIWNTPNIVGGESAGLLVVTGTGASIDMWCAVAGHYGQGMHGTVTIV